jgi:hypothetical protein
LKAFHVFHFIWIPNPGNCNDLQCFIPGECTNSQGLDILPSVDEFQCLESCQENTNCTWFSFFPDSNFCQTFSSCKNVDETLCPNCISGQRECENLAPTCFVQGNIYLDHLNIFLTAWHSNCQFFNSAFSLSVSLSVYQCLCLYKPSPFFFTVEPWNQFTPTPTPTPTHIKLGIEWDNTPSF